MVGRCDIIGKTMSKSTRGGKMHIIELPKEKYDYFELHYSYTTREHYKVELCSNKDIMSLVYTRQSYEEPKKVENTDTLYQDYWVNAEAYAVCDDASEEILGYVEIASDEWNNRLRMTQLLVKNEARGKGAGKFLVDFVKGIAKEREYKIQQ